MCISGGIFLTIISKDYFRFCLITASTSFMPTVS